jgi:RND superfamily putative drug exporter
MFHSLGRLTATHPWKVCAAWLCVAVLCTALAPPWDTSTQDDDIRFLPERCACVRGYRLLEQAFPQDVFASRLVFAVERSDRRLSAADFSLVDRLVADLEELRRAAPELQIAGISSFRDPFLGSRLTSGDGRCTLLQVSLGTPFLALQTQATVDRAQAILQHRLAAAGPNAPALYTTGSAGVGRDLTRACGASLDGTTVATIALVIVVLLLVYRAPLLALVPLVTIAVSVWVALEILALVTLIPGVHLVNISKVFAIVMLYGAGTDYCLFLISRYREELQYGGAVAALARSVGTVGGALAASAGTVMVGLALMGLAEFARVRYAGPAIALSLGVALLASLTLTPALLRLLGKAVFWPHRAPAAWGRDAVGTQEDRRLAVYEPHSARTAPQAAGFWEWVSGRVIARPMLIWGVAVLALLPLTVLGLRVTPNYRATGELPPSADSLRGLHAIQWHFTAGEVGPITVLLASPTDWNSHEGRTQLEHLSRGFAHLDNVAEVRSLTQPLGKPLPEPTVPEPPGVFGRLWQAVQPAVNRTLEKARAAAHAHYVAAVSTPAGSRFVTRMEVVLKSDPFDPASLATLKQIQIWLREELPRAPLLAGPLEAECYGVTVNAQDLAQVTEADRVRVNALMLVGIFLILVALVRRLVLAGYLLLTVLFSYYAALGATVLAGHAWAARPIDQIDWRVPFFLFTILVAVGEDYNILLMTRAQQERRRHGTTEGIRRALAHTGGAITSCGLIMAGTFATLMLAGLGTLIQIGFALAFGVLLDTFVVRPFLVPAFALLFWRHEDARPVRARVVDPVEELAERRLAG